MPVLFSLAVLGLLMIAAWRDIATRTIPDSIGLLIVVVGALSQIFERPSVLAVSAATALLLFVTLLIAYSRGLLGGGDVKIMTALAIGLSPFNSYRFIIATALAGGILAIAYLVLSPRLRRPYRAKPISLLARVAAVEAWRIRRRGSLPYGVAIAAGGAFVLFHPGSF